MTLRMPPPRTASHMVNHLHRAVQNMNALSRDLDVPVNILWTARRRPDYVFKTPYYDRQVTAAYQTARGFETFPHWIETRIDDLREAYGLAGKADGSVAPLKQMLTELWPLVDQRDGDFGEGEGAPALHYLAGTMMLVADLRKIASDLFPEDRIGRAVQDFEAAARRLVNPATRHRALLSLAAAKQRQAGGFVPLVDVLPHADLVFLHEMQQGQIDNSANDALNAVKLASVLRLKAPMLEAEAMLVRHDPAFADPDHPGWTPVRPVAADPDLAFYRQIKTR